ncbi:adenylyl-sulfate kinase [Candidatus Nitrosacidococcus sp. I8]|uniref:adenylyl-sulfate kinase n=1 Tax=Candidatus Nitrosacidococcus sp. I8 TaxID=2942908 RepID=UPI002226CB0D|nr:adenylyl-sulfate kinase [Candidatus Nitrosacidococcus sp. I8]CAH9019054.1 Adenylyl-sulfate kinase [Candidatus Nitrosacidococcus sp. I8]
MNTPTKNIVWHQPTVTRAHREQLNKHRSATLWFTGLSGAGKSTLAHAVEAQLAELQCRTFVLDGDNVRHGLCADLGFSKAARTENIRRISEICKLFVESGVIILTAFISPFHEDRQRARNLMGDDFLEIYCQAPLAICEQRDVKGLYRRARAGEIPDFTGISSPYEVPENSELMVNTYTQSVENSAHQVIKLLRSRAIIQS